MRATLFRLIFICIFFLGVPIDAMRRRGARVASATKGQVFRQKYMQNYYHSYSKPYAKRMYGTKKVNEIKPFSKSLFLTGKRSYTTNRRFGTGLWQWVRNKWSGASKRKKVIIGGAAIGGATVGGSAIVGLPLPVTISQKGFFKLIGPHKIAGGTERSGIDYLKQQISNASEEKVQNYWGFALSDLEQLLKKKFGIEVVLHLIAKAPDKVPLEKLNKAIIENIDTLFFAQKSPDLIKKLLVDYQDTHENLFDVIFEYAQQRSEIHKKEGGLDWWSSAPPNEIAEQLPGRIKPRNLIRVLSTIFTHFSEQKNKVVEYVKGESVFDMLLEFEDGIRLLHTVFKANKTDVNNVFIDLVTRKELSIANANKIVPARALLQSDSGVNFLIDLSDNDSVLDIINLFFTSRYYTYEEPTHLKLVNTMLGNKERMVESKKYKNIAVFLVKGIGESIRKIPADAAPYLARILKQTIPESTSYISKLFTEQSPAELVVNALSGFSSQADKDVLFELDSSIKELRAKQHKEEKETDELPLAISMDPAIKKVFLEASPEVHELIIKRAQELRRRAQETYEGATL